MSLLRIGQAPHVKLLSSGKQVAHESERGHTHSEEQQSQSRPSRIERKFWFLACALALPII